MRWGCGSFGEGHYISPHDAVAGNGGNNASHRELVVTGPSGSGWGLGFTGPTQVKEPAIFAWQNANPDVSLVTIDVPGDGRIHVASRATDNGDGTWHYEYAIQNVNSHRAVRSLSVPFDGCASNATFGSPGYHSGEPFSNAAWVMTIDSAGVSWSTDDEATDPDANAIRWGTLYNFGFDSPLGPTTVNADVRLFRSGSPGSVQAAVFAPASLCPADCAPAGGNGFVNVDDLFAVINGISTQDLTCDVAPVRRDCSVGNLVVNFDDVIGVVNAFGACP